MNTNIERMTEEQKRTWPILKTYALMVAEMHPEVEEIRAFGPFLKRSSPPNTFIDLLVVLRSSSIPIEDRHRFYAASGFRLAVNIYALTRREIRQELHLGNEPLARTLEDSKLVYP